MTAKETLFQSNKNRPADVWAVFLFSFETYLNHPMKNYILLIGALSLLSACKTETTPAKANVPKTEAKNARPANVTQRPTDTLVVTTRCAVDYWASEEKIEQLKRESKTEEEFYVAADDVGWYMSASKTYLDSIKFPVVSTKGYRYIHFKKLDGASVYIDTDTIHGIANIYLFDVSKNPVDADITYIQEAFKEYFETE